MVAAKRRVLRRQLRQAAGTALRFAKKKEVRHLAIAPAGDLGPADQVQLLAEGAILAAYQPASTRQRTKPAPGSNSSDSWTFRTQIPAGTRESHRRSAELHPRAGQRAGETADPKPFLASRAIQLGYDTNLEVEVLRKSRLEEMKMGALLGVAQGGAQPPVMIVVRYQPSAARDRTSTLAWLARR